MKHLTCILLCLLVCLSLVGCAPGGYLNSTDGDIAVSMPEKSEPELPEFTEEQKLILGKWTLVSITADGTENIFADSHYTFTEEGKFIAVVDGITDSGSFNFNNGVLSIGGEEVTYVIENDTLTISSSSNKVHLLKRVTEEPAE